ncbi:ATP-binding protein [Thermaurantiacus sp.]
MQGVGLLAAGLAHDLNTMLGGILAAAELLSARVPPDGDLAQDLGAIISQAERAGALIRKLLAFSRQEQLRPSRIDLARLLAQMEPVLRALLGRHIGLSLQSRRGTTVDADPQALERVVMNLVANARDAIGSQPGHVTIGLACVSHADLPHDAKRFMPERAYAALSVTDDGPGVPPALRARIFEPYFTTKGEGAGTGLGLPTAYGLIKQSGGFLLLDDAPRRGARFTIYLPVARNESDHAAPSGQPLLLLAEDEELLRSCARRGLEQAGYDVIAVADGAQAEAAFAANPAICALVSDVRMPGVDGVELARRLRARRPGLPVLLVSGYADASAREALGGLDVAFLAKPFRLADLERSVAALV